MEDRQIAGSPETCNHPRAMQRDSVFANVVVCGNCGSWARAGTYDWHAPNGFDPETFLILPEEVQPRSKPA